MSGRPDEQWGEAVTAIVVLRDGARIDAPDCELVDGALRDGPTHAWLRAHCADALAPYKVPKRIVLRVEPLPRTGSGKLLRREL